MARFYSTFDNSTVAGVEAATSGNRRERATMTGGAGLKSTLLAARTALSSAVYAQLDVANRSGVGGNCMPQDGYSRGGGNLTWTNLYTNSAAIWPSDPKTRPTSAIVVAGSSALGSPDSGSVTESLYTDGVTATQGVLSGIAAVRGGSGAGPYSYLGTNPYRTLLSIHHDHDMTYFAWDDFTPGKLAVFSASNGGPQAASADLLITFTWATQYPADREGVARINAQLSRNGGGASTSLSNFLTSANVVSYVWTIPGGTLTAGTYTLDAYVEARDATITTHFGTPSDDYFDASFITLS